MDHGLDVSLALVLILLIRLSGPFFSFKHHLVLAPFFAADVWYLDSCVSLFSAPSDPLLCFVQEVVGIEDRWPLKFSSLPACIPFLWGVWLSVFRSSLRRRDSRLPLLASAAFVLSRRLLRLGHATAIREQPSACLPDADAESFFGPWHSCVSLHAHVWPWRIS